MSSGRYMSRRLVPVAVTGLALLLAACGTAPAAVSSSISTSTSSSTTTTLPPLQRDGGKVTVLEVGDSLGVDLGWGMQWALGNDPKVNLVQDAKGDTGLANTGYYDWPAELESDIRASHPQIVVVFLGANDVQNFYAGNKYVSFGSPLWRQQYGARVATMMREATSAGARVLWVGMPIMQSPVFSASISKIDAVFERVAAGRPGVTYFSSWKLFSLPNGQFDGGTTNVAGTALYLRDPDGVHLDNGGEDLLGKAVLTELRKLYKLP